MPPRSRRSPRNDWETRPFEYTGNTLRWSADNGVCARTLNLRRFLHTVRAHRRLWNTFRGRADSSGGRGGNIRRRVTRGRRSSEVKIGRFQKPIGGCARVDCSSIVDRNGRGERNGNDVNAIGFSASNRVRDRCPSVTARCRRVEHDALSVAVTDLRRPVHLAGGTSPSSGNLLRGLLFRGRGRKGPCKRRGRLNTRAATR